MIEQKIKKLDGYAWTSVEIIDEFYLLHMNVYHHLSDLFLLSAMDQIELFPPVCKAAAPESIILDN